jgi:hypothetical protein
MVSTDDGEPYYLAGTEHWPEALEGKKVSVTGALRIRRGSASRATTAEGHTDSLDDDTFVLDRPSWRH